MIRMIDFDNLQFCCRYDSECMAPKESCYDCEDYCCTYKDLKARSTKYDLEEVLKGLIKERDRDISTIAVGKRSGIGLIEGRRIGLQEAINVIIEETGGLLEE